MRMTPGRETIQVVVFDGSREHPLLSSWLLGFPHVLRFRDVQPGKRGSIYLQTCRNRAVKWFQQETTLPWLLLLDDDEIPVSETEGLIVCEADVASAAYVSQKAEMLHPHPGGLCGGALKVSRYALEKIEPPWFGVRFSADGCDAVECECQWFERRAKAAGFHPVKAGSIGHIVSYLTLPTEDGGMKVVPLAGIPEALRRGAGQEKPTRKGGESDRQGNRGHEGKAVNDGPQDDVGVNRQGEGLREVGHQPACGQSGTCSDAEQDAGSENDGQLAGTHGNLLT
ncbi:MAG TPA: hypothetical protein VMY35_07665 [Phycisphaerae bacterium]|nr:hypothetical protein [Phycisphaerae bacterium]